MRTIVWISFYTYGLGMLVEDGSGPWSLDTSTDEVAVIDESQAYIQVIKVIGVDSEDIDNDGDSTQTVKDFAGWTLVNSKKLSN